MTPEGLRALKREYQELVEVKRPKAVKRMVEARNMGDLTENSEYTAARQDLAFIDRKISELEKILKTAKVAKMLNKKDKGKRKATIGSEVTLKDDKKKIVFKIVGEWEADPAKNRISSASPLGKALIGKGVGDKVEVQAPAGKVTYRILEIK